MDTVIISYNYIVIVPVLQRAYSKYQRDGLVALFISGTNLLAQLFIKYLRFLFPIKRNAVRNNVKVPPEGAPNQNAPYYRIIDDYQSVIQPDYENSEGGEVESHKEFTQPGDTVVIIGGGRGTSTMHAAWESEPNGQVIVFEPSKKHSQIIREVVELNATNSLIKIKTVLVGPDIEVFGDSSGDNYQKIHPEELPQCDVLEMDCEGAELEIIKNIRIRPHVIILEVHPQRYQYAPEAIDELIDRGYDITKYLTNDGESINKSQFDRILKQCSRGEAPAPIVVAVNTSVETV